MTKFETPTLALLVKLGSLIVHLDEARKPGGHEFDLAAANALLADPEVAEWIESGNTLAFLPRRR